MNRKWASNGKSHLHTVDVCVVLKTGKASFRGKEPWTVVEPCLANPRKPPLQVLLRFWSLTWGTFSKGGESKSLQLGVLLGCGIMSKSVD